MRLVHLKHLFEDLDGLLQSPFLLEPRNHLAVLGQGVTDQSLLVVQRAQGEGDGGVVRGKTLDLLVDGYRLQKIGVVGVVLADILVLRYRLVLPVVPDQELGQLLPIPHLFRIEGHHLLVVLDCLVELPLQQKALRAFQQFVFFRSQ